MVRNNRIQGRIASFEARSENLSQANKALRTYAMGAVWLSTDAFRSGCF
jgi:hypothetical protein